MLNRHFPIANGLLLSLLLLLPAAADTPDPVRLMEQVRAASLDTGGSVEVSRLSIDMGLGTIEIASGWLIPAKPIEGRVLEIVFLGEARVEIEPPNAIEASQLNLFTDQESLDVSISSAVLVMGDAALSTRLLQRDRGTPAAEVVAEAQTAYESWVAGAQRRGFGADAAILRAILGDRPYGRYFAALFESEDHGRFQYIFDPSEQEQLALGQFVPIELDDREKDKVEKTLRRQRREGRSLQTRLADLGDWNTWMQAMAHDAEGRPTPGASGFEPSHYTMDVTLDPKQEQLSGIVTIDAVVQGEGRRVAALSLASDLKVNDVRDGQARSMPWLRSGGELYVVLPEETASGSSIRLQVDYAGVMFTEFEPGVFPLRDTYSWYPHLGTVDRATYRTTFHYPKKFTLLSSGRTVEDIAEDGIRTVTKELEIPAFGFTFEIGDFDVTEHQVGHVTLTVGIAKTTMGLEAGAREDVIETLKDALAYYEETFGTYPLDYLTVATVPRGFSQGFISCVTLSQYLMTSRGGVWVVKEYEGNNPRKEGRIETVAHELAHQWWGNIVGWDSYRDQWLSEALADYSAVQYASSRANSKPIYLAQHARQWKAKLASAAGKGTTVESLGPVVLGRRLFSSLSSSAYSAIVYDKGSIVFGMLARTLDREPFNRMLRALAERVSNRVVSTETFIKAIEHMSETDLQPFAEQYVYGTGIPEIYYRFEFKSGDDGKWIVSGEARQAAAANFRYALEQTEHGGWDVTRRRIAGVEFSDRTFVAPFQILLADSGAESAEAKKKKDQWFFQSGRGLGGNLLVSGLTTEFSFEIAEEPRDFFIDQSGEVLAYFYCETREPKKMLRYRAMELAGEEAEELLRRALTAEMFPESIRGGLQASDKELQQRSDYEDALIHLELSRIYLDLGRDADATKALQTGESLLTGVYKNYAMPTRDALRSRLELRRGAYKEGWARLSRSLRLTFPRTGEGTLGSEIRRNKWRTGARRTGDGEDYALLAVVAANQQQADVAFQAIKEAEERGADLSRLKEAYPELLAVGSSP